MTMPVVYGAPYSVYVRAVRLTLEEKGVPYRLEEVDVFRSGGVPAAHLKRHPFGKIPAFEHDGFALYETGAITRYIDEAFPGPPLQPLEARSRARMNQALSILDAYAYPTLVWGLYVELVDKVRKGAGPDEARVTKARAAAKVCLDALDQLAQGPWLAGRDLTLADLHGAPMFAYFNLVGEAAEMMRPFPRLTAWWETMSERESMNRTQPGTDNARHERSP